MFVFLFKRPVPIFFLLLLFSYLDAAEFDARIGGFYPQSELFRDMYGTVIPTYQLEASWDLPKHFT